MDSGLWCLLRYMRIEWCIRLFGHMRVSISGGLLSVEPELYQIILAFSILAGTGGSLLIDPSEWGRGPLIH